MDHIRKALPFLKARMKKEEEEERPSNFLRNGSLVLEELIATFGGRYKLPIRSFTAKELITASNNFCEQVHHINDSGYLFRANFEGRPVLIKLYEVSRYSEIRERVLNGAIRNLVISSQMSHLKNVLKFVGCSFEFRYPAIVYEYAGTELLPKYLSDNNDGKLLSWRSRIKIASDIANVIAHLHSAFPKSIIYRDLKPNKVIIDQCGVAKLFDFTSSISLPPGELQVEDPATGTYGYLDPQYMISGFVTQRSDVYSFGVLMFMLFTGETATFKYDEIKAQKIHLIEYVHRCLENDQFSQIVDPKLLEGEGNINVPEKYLLDFLGLAFRCTEYEGIYRPDMIDVAKQLLEIEKSVRYC